jgi:hypothetical protein
MTGAGGFLLVLVAGIISVLLLGWQGYRGYEADWVFGFLAVLWSLMMLMRLISLTAPHDPLEEPSGLAQKIILLLRQNHEKNRQKLLEISFGGSFVLFLSGIFVFAAWQIYCAAFSEGVMTMHDLRARIGVLAGDALWATGKVFDWGQLFMLLLSLSMMGFVLRSYAIHRSITRAVMIILSGYAVAGLVAFSGLEASGVGFALAGSDAAEQGIGGFLLGPLKAGDTMSLFDIVLLQSGLGGLAIITFLLFVPIGCISLAATKPGMDRIITVGGVMVGVVMILATFLSFTPALGAFLALCWIGLFLSWGASEYNLHMTAA